MKVFLSLVTGDLPVDLSALQGAVGVRVSLSDLSFTSTVTADAQMSGCHTPVVYINLG